jgi:O-antigen/teichoic acid export membrane protein
MPTQSYRRSHGSAGTSRAGARACILGVREAAVTEKESLTGAATRGGVYVLVRRVIANVIRIATVAVLARELDAAEFGIAALAQIALSFLTVFGSGGIITYIVCDREPDWATRIHPAFWLNMTLATASCVIAAACTPLVVLFYGDPLIGWVLLVILADYFIDQAKMVPEGLLKRRLQFRVIAVRDTVRDLATAGLGIVMALSGWGVWSLVLPNLLAAPFDVLYTSLAARFRPRLALGTEWWPKIFRFTRSVIGEQFLTFIGNEADTAIVGKAMGNATVGVYNLAYQLANLIGKNVSAVVTMVSTPALATAFERQTGLGTPYRRMMRVLSLVSTPVLLGMFVLANELVLTVYGPKWLEAVPLLRIFIVFALVRAVTSPSGAIFNVVGRPELSMMIVVWYLVLYLPALIVTAYYGDVIAIALCVAVARFAVGLVSLYMSLALIDESRMRVTRELAGPLMAGLGMAIVCWLLNSALFDARMIAVARIVFVAIVGAAVYYILARLFARRALDESVALIREVMARRRQRNTSERR